MATLARFVVRTVAFLMLAMAFISSRGQESVTVVIGPSESTIGSELDVHDLGELDGQACADCPDCPTLDVWVVSTRCLPCVGSLPTHARLGVERLGGEPGCRRWERATLEELIGEPWRPLVVFVHGNRYEAFDAKIQGMVLARRLAAHAHGQAPRVVIFSWPSEQDGHLLQDGRRKYARAYCDGHYLAWFLSQLEPAQPVAIVGYSFGALVSAEALDDLSRVSPSDIPWAERPGRTNLVFVVPALRCDAFAPRGAFRHGLDGIDGFSLVINSQDKPLKFFPLLEPAVRVEAMGAVGMSRRWLPAEIDYSATDAARTVGKLHTLWRYLESGSLSARIAHGSLAGMGE